METYTVSKRSRLSPDAVLSHGLFDPVQVLGYVLVDTGAAAGVGGTRARVALQVPAIIGRALAR